MTDNRTDSARDRGSAPSTGRDDDSAPERDDEGDAPTGRFARVKTAVTEALGVAVDAVFDAI